MMNTVNKFGAGASKQSLSNSGSSNSNDRAATVSAVAAAINLVKEFNNNISMNGYAINNLQTPMGANDAATKDYVDSRISTAAATRVATDPEHENDLTNKRYVDRKVHESSNNLFTHIGTVSAATIDTNRSILEVRDNLDDVSQTVTGLSTTAAVPRYVKSNCGLVPVVRATNNKSGFKITSSSFTEHGVFIIFIGYLDNISWMPNVDSVVGSEAWVKIALPMSVKIHKFHVSSIHTNTAKKPHTLTLTGSLGVKAPGTTSDIEYQIFTTTNALLNNEVSSFDIPQPVDAYNIYKLKIYSPEIARPGLSYMQLFSLDPVV